MIQVRGLEKRYGRKQVLTGVSFSLDSGITGLLGPNGAGKTTLLRCLLGIVKPSAGEVVLGDEEALRQRVGYLPQRFGLLRELTVHEALLYFAALKEIPQAEAEEDIDECLRSVNLQDSKTTKVAALSGGMTRRVGIASALLGDPSVLVFDEPTAGLDPEERVRFKRLVAGLAENRTVLISTHIVEDIEAVATYVIVLDQGAIRASGTLQDVAGLAEGKCYRAPRNRINEYSEDYYVDGYTEVDGEAVARVLSKRSYEGFVSRTPTVEDGYLCVIRDLA
ncbi:MAG: ATP-binding cassette domain-containing protein [Coriobacteriia bacterium]